MARPRGASSDDREIGARLRWARQAIRVTRAQVGEVLGVSGQQILYYERGRSRMSAGQLVAVARAFKIPIARLFGEIDSDPSIERYKASIQLIHDFSALDESLQKIVLDLARALASQTTDQGQE